MGLSLQHMLGGLLLVTSSAATSPARAEPVVENEALVMRLIFDDCFGYVRDDKPPFRGLQTRQAPRGAVNRLPSPPGSRVGTVELLSSRYIAAWGASAGDRYCIINRASYGEDERQPALLGVRRAGFIERVSARAARYGLTQRDGDELSPVSIIGWRQPGRDAPSGPDRSISFTMLPTAKDDRTDIVEIGTFAMGGPPLSQATKSSRR